MSLESIVNVTIQPNARGVTRSSFGIEMVVGKHDAWAERYREYTSATALADLVSDGIAATTQIYKAVRSYISQTPRAEKVVVGRLIDDYDYESDLTVQSPVAAPTVGEVYGFDVRSPDGTVTAVAYTVQVADTYADVATAVAALVNAITDITSSALVNVISNAADNSNETFQFEGIDESQFHYLDTTVDSTLATEVGQIDVIYPDWYGLVLADCPSNARITALAAYAETVEKIFGAVSHDHENGATGTSSAVMYDLNAADYFRTYTIFSNDQNSHAGAGWMGTLFPLDAGSATWKFKSISGTLVDTLTTTFRSNVLGLNGNTYTTIAGLPTTENGTMASGEWIDVVRGRDWFVAEVRANVFGVLRNAAKVPYTDKGVALITKEVRAAQTAGVGRTFLAADPAPFVTAPLVADVSAANKVARILPDVYFEQTLAGAIHAVTLYGVLKV